MTVHNFFKINVVSVANIHTRAHVYHEKVLHVTLKTFSTSLPLEPCKSTQVIGSSGYLLKHGWRK